jgi:hypothetical protein
MSVPRIVLSTILATAFGALSGGALLGLPTYFSKECGFLGCDREWAFYAAIWGAIFGVVPGACIGLIVSRFKLNATLGGLAGGGVGFAILLIFFASNGWEARVDDEWFLVSVASIPIGAIIGLFIVVINRRVRLAAAQQIVGRERRERVL